MNWNWIKIEPGCKMPDFEDNILLQDSYGDYWTICIDSRKYQEKAYENFRKAGYVWWCKIKGPQD